MALTPIGLCSRALIKIGAASITGFTDGTAEAEVADALYGSTRDALLSANAWSFATVQATLARLAEAEFRRARLIDVQQDSQPGFEDFTLVEARGR